MNSLAVDELRKELLLWSDSGTIITGGHFKINEEGVPILNEGTIFSFKFAAEICKEIGADFGLFINDIGSTCDEDICEIKKINFSRETFTLPKEYLIDVVPTLIWEKHVRNRATLEMRRRQVKSERTDIVKDSHGNYWLVDESSPLKIILSKPKGASPYGLPSCPLIMGAYFLYLESLGYKKSLNIWYVASDNLENIPNHFMIEKGARVARAFGAKIEIKNVYIKPEEISMSRG